MRLKSVLSDCFSDIFSMISSGENDLRNRLRKLASNDGFKIKVDILKNNRETNYNLSLDFKKEFFEKSQYFIPRFLTRNP